MILYFSSTGNCKYIAQRLEEVCGGPALAMDQILRQPDKTLSIPSGETLAFVVPTYYGVLPNIVERFFASVTLQPQGPVTLIGVQTYGGHYGNTIDVLQTRLEEHLGQRAGATFKIKMVDNWIPMFDLSDEAVNRAVEEAAEPEIDAMVEAIRRGDTPQVIPEFTPEELAPMVEANEALRLQKPFTLDEGCISCGTCEAVCPADVIELVDGTPVWQTDACTMCLACVHRCPVNVIVFDDATRGHGQYYHSKAKPE